MWLRRAPGCVVLALALALLLGCSAAGEVQPAPGTGTKQGGPAGSSAAPAAPAGNTLPAVFRPKAGVAAAEVAGTDVLHHRHVSLSDLKGQVVFLNFWATWCNPCRAEMPVMNQLQKELGDKVRFLAFDQDAHEEPEEIIGFAKQVNVDLPLIWDEGKAGRVYRIIALPVSVVIGRDGKITAMHTGQADRQQMLGLLKTAGV